jgi:hypothetical protein
MSPVDDLSRPWKRRRDIVELSEEQPGNPVAYSIASAKDRSRGWLPDDLVNRRAKKLHGESSYASWASLDEKDKELWRHLARVQLIGDGPVG